jgi:fibronectin type 3 domain-containing protein
MFRTGNRRAVTFLLLFLLCGVPAFGAGQSDLAILNLRPTNLEAMGYDGEILYALISELEKEKTIALMPRREMEDTLFNAGLVQGDSPELALQAGKALAINFVLFGRVSKKMGRIDADLNLMDVQNGRVVKEWQRSFTGRDDIISGMPVLASELVNFVKYRSRTPSAVAPAPKAADLPGVTIENLQAKSLGKKVVLTWKSELSQPIAGFHVYRSEHQNGPYQFLGKTDQNLFEDTKIKRGVSYFYRIGILDRSGREVKDRQTVEVKNAGERAPHPPLLMGATPYIRRAEIKFVPSLLNDQEKFKIKQYKVYRKKSTAEAWEHLSTVRAKTSSQSGFGFTVMDDNDLADGESYLYAVASIDRKGRESARSDPLTVLTTARPKLSVFKDGLLRKVVLSWESIAGVEGYAVYREEKPKTWAMVGRVKGSETKQFTDDKDLEDHKTYRYYLTAYDSSGETGPSDIVHAGTKELPAPPSDVYPKSDMVRSVLLSWIPVEDPDVGGYAIYRGTGRDDLKRVAKVKGYKTGSYLDKDKTAFPIEDGAFYYYAVAGFNLFGAEGAPSPYEIARTKPSPGPVKGVKAAAAVDRIAVEWALNAESDISGYMIYRSRNNGSFSRLETVSPRQTSYDDMDLKPDTTYRYRVIAQDKDGLESDPVDSDAVSSPVSKPGS